MPQATVPVMVLQRSPELGDMILAVRANQLAHDAIGARGTPMTTAAAVASIHHQAEIGRHVNPALSCGRRR
jgi:hypothetical protein